MVHFLPNKVPFLANMKALCNKIQEKIELFNNLTIIIPNIINREGIIVEMNAQNLSILQKQIYT